MSKQAKSDLDAISEASNLFLTPVKVEGAENLAVMKFGYASGSLGPTGIARFTAEIKNFDRQPNGGSVATLLINGQPESRQPLGTMAAGETRAVSFFTSLDLVGSAKMSVSLSPDSLSNDNERHTVVEARKQVRILCVDGEPASVTNENTSEIFWLVKALALKQVGGSETDKRDSNQLAGLGSRNFQGQQRRGCPFTTSLPWPTSPQLDTPWPKNLRSSSTKAAA